MGSIRSLEKTAGKFYTPETPQKYHWIDRGKDYDRDREQERRQIKPEHEKTAYIQDLGRGR